MISESLPLGYNYSLHLYIPVTVFFLIVQTSITEYTPYVWNSRPIRNSVEIYNNRISLSTDISKRLPESMNCAMYLRVDICQSTEDLTDMLTEKRDLGLHPFRKKYLRTG